MQAIYIRVSTDSQDYAAQTHACTQYAPTAAIYADTASGKTMDRAKVQELLKDIRAGKITQLIVYELSRLSRNMLTIAALIAEINKYGVELHVVSDGGSQNLDGTVNQFMQLTKGMAAQFEREKIAARTKSGLAAAKARGVVLGAPAGNTYRQGFRKKYDPETIKLVVELKSKSVKVEMICQIAKLSRSSVYRLLKVAK